jgi:hypothetical protein
MPTNPGIKNILSKSGASGGSGNLAAKIAAQILLRKTRFGQPKNLPKSAQKFLPEMERD